MMHLTSLSKELSLCTVTKPNDTSELPHARFVSIGVSVPTETFLELLWPPAVPTQPQILTTLSRHAPAQPVPIAQLLTHRRSKQRALSHLPPITISSMCVEQARAALLVARRQLLPNTTKRLSGWQSIVAVTTRMVISMLMAMRV